MFGLINLLIEKIYDLFRFPIYFNPKIVLKKNEEFGGYDSDKNDYYGELFRKNNNMVYR